jgi:KaiC/GvpD/RAD55 family RecA-like ATPase
VGKFEYLVALTRGWLDRGERVVLVTLDLSPEEFLARARDLGVDLAAGEPAAVQFVDCYSANAIGPQARTDGRLTVSSFSNLESLGMTIQKAAVALRPPVRILFYTLSTLFLHNSTPAIAKFLQIMTSRVKTAMGFVAYVVHEGVHEPTTMNLLRSLTDGVVELRFTEAMEREVRLHHMRGRWVVPQWQPLPPGLEVVRA